MRLTDRSNRSPGSIPRAAATRPASSPCAPGSGSGPVTVGSGSTQRPPGPPRSEGGQGAAEGQGDIRAEEHGAADVADRRRRAVAQIGTDLDAVAVAAGATEADAQGGGEGGLGHPALGDG